MSVLVALLLTFVLPALAGGVLLAGRPPERSEPGEQAEHSEPSGTPETDARAVRADVVVARGIACGVAAWLLGSGLLTRPVGLTTTSSWVWDAAVAALSLVVLLLPRHRARVRAGLAPVGRRLAEVAGISALVYLPLAYVVVHTTWSPIGSTPWYYYGLARQVADVGSIPATSVEFATSTPFLNDYHLFTTGTAMLLLQHDQGPIAVLTTVTLLSALLLGIGAAALTSALGAGRVTSLLAVPVAMATGLGPIRLSAYRPEGFGLGLALIVAALALDWLNRRDRRSLAAAALLVAVLSQVHGIAALTAGVLVVAAASVLVVQGARREQLVRTGVALAVFAAAVLVTGLVFREASGTVHAGGLVDQGGPADPTWEFYEAARGHAPSTPPSNGSMLWDTLRALYSGSWWWTVPALLLAGLGLWRRRREPLVRRLVGVVALSLLGLALASSVFMLGWQGYVPRRTGASRIPLEASLLLPPLVAIGLGCLARDAWTWRRRSGTRTLRRPRLLLLGVLTVAGVVSVLGAARYDDGGSVSRDQLALWESLPLRANDVVLANGYTEGFIPDVTPAQGLLDGRAPYTFGDVLRRANGLLRGAQAFYADPAGHWDYLARNHVTWVVVGSPYTYALSTGNTWYVPKDPGVLARCAGLQRVVDDPALTVFRVVDAGPTGCRAGA